MVLKPFGLKSFETLGIIAKVLIRKNLTKKYLFCLKATTISNMLTKFVPENQVDLI